MKRFVILILALLMLALYGCGGDCGIVPENTEATATVPEATEVSTYHPENTYAILRAEADRINRLIRDENSKNLLPFDVTYISIDDSNSVIVVGIKDITDEKVEFFKENISDKDYIVFEEGGNVVFTAK